MSKENDMSTLLTATDTQLVNFFDEIKSMLITHEVNDNTISMVASPESDKLSLIPDETRWFDNTPSFQARMFGCSNLAYCGVRNIFKLPEDWYVDVLILEHLKKQADKLDYNKRDESDTGSEWY